MYDLLLHHPATIQSVLIAADQERRESDQQRRLRASLKISSFRCSDATFSTLSHLDSPQGILAIVKQPRWNEEKLLERQRIFGVFGEHLQDPANVGTIIRTAAALNVDALWLTPESADIYNPKVVRASAGAVLSLPIFVAEDAAGLKRKRIKVFAAEAGGGEAVEMERIRTIPKRLVVAVGNESRGLSRETIQQAVCRFTIPLSRHIESLNVAATAAIALHYLQRIDVET